MHIQPSPQPGTAQTADKAIAAGAVGTAVAFLSSLSQAAPGGLTGQEWVDIALATVIGGAAAFGITYSVPNRAK